MTTTNNNYPEITAENIQSIAKKAAYVSLRTLSQNSGDSKYSILQQAIIANDIENQDAQDILQVATLALWENKENPDAFMLALKAINNYVYSLRSVKGKNHIAYIVDHESANGEIVNVNSGISHIIKGIEASEQLDNIIRHLSYSQKEILKYMAYGYTVKQIAEKLKRKLPTVKTHIARIKAAAKTLYPEGTN